MTQTQHTQRIELAQVQADVATARWSQTGEATQRIYSKSVGNYYVTVQASLFMSFVTVYLRHELSPNDLRMMEATISDTQLPAYLPLADTMLVTAICTQIRPKE